MFCKDDISRITSVIQDRLKKYVDLNCVYIDIVRDEVAKILNDEMNIDSNLFSIWSMKSCNGQVTLFVNLYPYRIKFDIITKEKKKS